MEMPNAFIGQTNKPTQEELKVALGPGGSAWAQFLRWMEEELHITTREWQSISAKYGWPLRIKRKERAIVCLAPCRGCFRASFVLGKRAMEAVHETRFPGPVAKAIEEAPHYAEETGVRIVVHDLRDLGPIRTLTAIKLSH
jgi:Protein of unknown function (DUF3788)